MKKRFGMVLALAMALSLSLLAACGGSGADSSQSEKNQKSDTQAASTTESSESETDQTVSTACDLEDGDYLADFETDSNMFRINEAKDGKGILHVENGQMTIHIVLVSENILNLYVGLAEDAETATDLLEPTEETVDYSDGTSDVAYAFDVPVPALDTEFDLALIGTKGKWYDHKVSVSNPTPYEEAE